MNKKLSHNEEFSHAGALDVYPDIRSKQAIVLEVKTDDGFITAGDITQASTINFSTLTTARFRLINGATVYVKG